MKFLFVLLIFLGFVSKSHADKLYLVCEKDGFETLDIILDPYDPPSSGWRSYFYDSDPTDNHKSRINGEYMHIYELSNDEIVLTNMWIVGDTGELTETWRINRVSGKLVFTRKENAKNSSPKVYDCVSSKKNQF